MTHFESTTVRFGMAGVGRMGMYHLERWSLRSDCIAVACHDIDSTRLDAAASFGCRPHASWDDFLRDTNIDVVWIATSPSVRAQLAMEALDAGKHVVVEPPVCLTLGEADRLIAASRRSAHLVSVAYRHRWDDDFQAARKVLQTGQIGRVTNIARITWGYGFPNRSLDESRTEGRADSQWSSVLLEFGVHYVDQLLTLVTVPAESVFARFPDAPPADLPGSGMCATPPYGTDAFLTVITFTNGVCARIDVNQASPVSLDTGWTITGTEGGYRDFRSYRLHSDGEIYDAMENDNATDWDLFYDALVQSLRAGESAAIPMTEARRVTAVIDAVRRSALTGDVVRVGSDVNAYSPRQ